MRFNDAEAVLAVARKTLSYNPETGVVTRIARASNAPAGVEAGWKGAVYRYVGVLGVQYPTHRIIWLMVCGRWPQDRVDHINGNQLDNRLFNLREATATLNLANARMRSDNSTGFKGVVLCKRNKSNPFRATIRINGRTQHLGYFSTAEAAHAAYEHGAHTLFGEFARTT